MRLIDVLDDGSTVRPTGVPAVAAWRVYAVEKHTVDASLRRGRFGGPYNPPSLKNSVEAEVFIHWADGKCTHGTLNRAQLERPAESLAVLYGQAYVEPWPDLIPGPTDPAEVQVCVAPVRDAILRDPTALLAPVHRMETTLRRLDTDQVRGHLSAQYARVTVASSAGMRSEYETTRISYGAVLAARAWFNHELRGLPDDAMINRRLERVVQDLERLEHPWDGALRAPRVYLSPGIVQQFLNFYLLQNLSMQAVLNGTSAFARAQLEEGAPLFDPDLTVIDVSNRDHHPSAFPLCGRGQPAAERPLIDAGRLVGADVSLRAAAQGGLAPTPTSVTGNWVLRDASDRADGKRTDTAEISRADLESAVRSVDNGVYIYSILGLHTQDATRGAYSLGVPRALVIRDGRVLGGVRGTLQGNFFDDLKEARTRLRDPLEDMPILGVSGRFTSA